MRAEDLRLVAEDPELIELLPERRAASPGDLRDALIIASGMLLGLGFPASAISVLVAAERLDGEQP